MAGYHVYVQTGVDGGRAPETKPKLPDDMAERGKSWKLTEITDPTQCRSTRLPDTLPPNKVSYSVLN